MLYITLKNSDAEYKLRLNIKGLINLEKRLGKSPMEAIGDSLEDMMIVFHESLQAYQHGISFDDACDICDKWCDEGHTQTEDLPILLLQVYAVSGMIKQEYVDEVMKSFEEKKKKALIDVLGDNEEKKPTKGKSAKNS